MGKYIFSFFMFLDLILFKMKKFKSPQFLNLITSLLIFVLSFALMHSEAMSVECKTSDNTSSCDVTTAKTQPIGKFTGSKSLTVNFQADVTARFNKLINVDATNASNIFTNFQTIKNTQPSGGDAIFINGTINLLKNEGTIESTGAGTRNKGIRLENGTLNTLENSGKIEGNNDYAISLEGISKVGTITNENTGDIYALSNSASSTIGSIENRGNILASSSNNKGAITNLSNIKGITLIRNDGNITAFNSTSNYGIYNNYANITTIENNGTISSAYGSSDIWNNNGTIETLINGQGGSDALVFRGNLPTNYEIKISNTDYGKLEGFRLTGSGTINFLSTRTQI